MIPVLPTDKPVTVAEKLAAYHAERDTAAYKIIADNMDRILHGGDKNHPNADTEYDVLKR